MKYFEKFTSATVAGSGNQHVFYPEEGAHTGRVYYKLAVTCETDVSILFSNIVDSTYADGAASHANLVCDSWRILSARVGTAKNVADENLDMTSLFFDGQTEKEVMPGEIFPSDPVRLKLAKGEYLCLEVTFSGRMIPYHEESLLPAFALEDGKWTESKKMPFASMVGCARPVKGKIAYLGDSITQGIGPAPNSYEHWTALIADMIGDEYSHWNLGLGFGRASDAASDSAWLFKAKQCDTVFVCFGVNDILQGHGEEKIKKDITRIVEILKNAGKRVILQTVPPFDYRGGDIEKWENINRYIRTELSEKADLLFDNVPVLCGDEPHRARYGGHPNAEGGKVWAKALYAAVKELF